MWVQEIWCKSSNLCTDLGNYTLMYVCFTCWLVGWLVGYLVSQLVRHRVDGHVEIGGRFGTTQKGALGFHFSVIWFPYAYRYIHTHAHTWLCAAQYSLFYASHLSPLYPCHCSLKHRKPIRKILYRCRSLPLFPVLPSIHKLPLDHTAPPQTDRCIVAAVQ